jgi:hypothetical protein
MLGAFWASASGIGVAVTPMPCKAARTARATQRTDFMVAKLKVSLVNQRNSQMIVGAVGIQIIVGLQMIVGA